MSIRAFLLAFFFYLSPTLTHVDGINVVQTRVGYAFPGLVSFHVGGHRYLFMNGQVTESGQPFSTVFNGETFTSH